MLRIALASLHLVAFGIGLGAVWMRARALRGPLERGGLARAFTADAWWGLSALLLLSTGLWRLFGETEKTSAYYLANHVFYAKMGFLVLILLLEIGPMITLIRWRRARSASSLNTSAVVPAARRIVVISYIQALLLVAMVIAATMMTRGYGAR